AGRLASIEEALAGISGDVPGAKQPPAKQPAASVAPPSAAPSAPVPKPRTGPSPLERDATRKAAGPPAPPAAAPGSSVVAPTPPVAAPSRPAAAPAPSDIRARLLEVLVNQGAQFTADAVEHSDVIEQGAEIQILAPAEFAGSLALSESQLRKAAEQVLGRQVRIKVTTGEPVSKPTAPAAPKSSAKDEELLERALADPAVQRFREAFPNAEVRQIRNLKE
ncbi:MAG TPA: DNA polymerase III subunit gamma/tau, partial [Bryobacteraceae bacterium]|nr:DNA polymerase III subunit gamma/tau [Bryobacteraceae bacterium]